MSQTDMPGLGLRFLTNWWRRRTLRMRLAVWYSLMGTVLLGGFSGTLYFYVFHRMARPLDHQLKQDIETIRRDLAILPDGSLQWNGRPMPRDASWTTTYPWLELWDSNGELVRRLWPFSDNRVQQLPGPPARGRETLSVFRVAPDLRLRVLSVPLEEGGQGRGWMLRAMRVHEPVGDALGALQWIIVLALPVVVALLVCGGFLITRRWLSPLTRMTAEAKCISADDLSRRLPVVNPDDELGRLATVFNLTLNRLEAAFTALDRFVADASHELRTPLTTLRSVGEVGLRKTRSVEEYREIIGSMLEEAARLQTLVGRLLELATAEGGAPAVHRQEVQLDTYVGQLMRELSVLAETRSQQLLLDVRPCRISTDPVILRQALQNLIDNATKYSPENSTILVTVSETDTVAEIAVSDEGPGISEQDRPRLMQRFFRPDRARDRSTGGFGLGLSITRAYLRQLGGELCYRARKPRGSTFLLVLPKSGAAPIECTGTPDKVFS